MDLWYERIDYLCPYVNLCKGTSWIAGHSKFFYTYSFVHQFYLWHYIKFFIIILQLLFGFFFYLIFDGTFQCLYTHFFLVFDIINKQYQSHFLVSPLKHA